MAIAIARATRMSGVSEGVPRGVTNALHKLCRVFDETVLLWWCRGPGLELRPGV